MLTDRDCDPDDAVPVMQAIAAAAWPEDRPAVRFHIGGIAWYRTQHVGREREWRIRIWWDGPRPVGFGWFWAPEEALLLAARPYRESLVPEIAGWLVDRARAAGADSLTVEAVDRDLLTCAALAGAAFVRVDAPTQYVMVRSLAGRLPDPQVEDGFRVRHMAGGDDDVARRVAVHRAAFSVFKPSRVTGQSYRQVMAAWPYRCALDWVVEAPDGRFAAACLAWIDEDNAVGELEPVGSDPAFWRRGFARAVCSAALRALREHGADTALVGSVEMPGYPSAPALYRSLGFRMAGRLVTFRRPT
jgi:GNAT superfamily N-acetyltransferase